MKQNPAIEIGIACPLWTEFLPGLEERVGQAAARALAAGSAGWSPGELARMEISLVLADDAMVRELNGRYRGKDMPTNVLSFAALDDVETVPADGPILMGDVVIAYQTVAAEAAADHKTLADHLTHLVVHGVLHLLGYDHEDDEEEAVLMERLETAILAEMGIADPYGGHKEQPEGQ